MRHNDVTVQTCKHIDVQWNRRPLVRSYNLQHINVTFTQAEKHWWNLTTLIKGLRRPLVWLVSPVFPLSGHIIIMCAVITYSIQRNKYVKLFVWVSIVTSYEMISKMIHSMEMFKFWKVYCVHLWDDQPGLVCFSSSVSLGVFSSSSAGFRSCTLAPRPNKQS